MQGFIYVIKVLSSKRLVVYNYMETGVGIDKRSGVGITGGVGMDAIQT